MNHRTKLLAGALIAAVALTGVLVGTISADEKDEAVGPRQQLMARAAERLELNQQDPEHASREAKQEVLQNRQARRLYRIIEERVVTESRANECREWRGARPDTDEDFDRMKGIRGGKISCEPMLARLFCLEECPAPGQRTDSFRPWTRAVQ